MHVNDKNSRAQIMLDGIAFLGREIGRIKEKRGPKNFQFPKYARQNVAMRYDGLRVQEINEHVAALKLIVADLQQTVVFNLKCTSCDADLTSASKEANLSRKTVAGSLRCSLCVLKEDG